MKQEWKDKLVFKNNTSVPTMDNATDLSSTAISGSSGVIYVPDNLVDSWKSATNWSNFANKIKGLSELT